MLTLLLGHAFKGIAAQHLLVVRQTHGVDAFPTTLAFQDQGVTPGPSTMMPSSAFR